MGGKNTPGQAYRRPADEAANSGRPRSSAADKQEATAATSTAKLRNFAYFAPISGVSLNAGELRQGLSMLSHDHGNARLRRFAFQRSHLLACGDDTTAVLLDDGLSF